MCSNNMGFYPNSLLPLRITLNSDYIAYHSTAKQSSFKPLQTLGKTFEQWQDESVRMG